MRSLSNTYKWLKIHSEEKEKLLHNLSRINKRLQDLQKKEDRLLKDLLAHTNKQLIQDRTFSPCVSGIPSASGVNPRG
jgi:flagellar motility protein MotE (MotC chaperone)